jgi:hypothetical protein
MEDQKQKDERTAVVEWLMRRSRFCRMTGMVEEARVSASYAAAIRVGLHLPDEEKS